MAPHLESTWEEYIQPVKFWRNEVKRSLGEAITRLELLNSLDGQPTILGLATAPGDSSSSQMVMHTQIPMNTPLPMDESEERPILELKPLVDSVQMTQQQASTNQQQQPPGGKPPPELALHYERLRGHIVSGVTAYSVHVPSGAILISTCAQLSVYKNKQVAPIAQWMPPFSPVLNASFCKLNPEYVAFNSGNQLLVDRNNSQVFKTDSGPARPHITNGVAAFVTQEEFERYEGYWWSPTRVELLYERVDESTVSRLAFTLPGASADEQPMRYPLAGTPNATSSLRLCGLDEQSGQFVDLDLDACVEAVVPWMEYMVRIGWTSDGNDVFVMAMNRVQTQMAILLIPRTLFAQNAGQGVGRIRVVYEETTPYWVNANNMLHFLPNSAAASSEERLQFVLGSERSDKCHLYLQTFELANGITSRPITAGDDWAVLKEAIPKLDLNRGLIFFLANRTSPIVLSLCVSALSAHSSASSNNGSPSDCRVLTPANMSYKFERSDPSQYLNPDIGFVCWLSAVDRLPECRFYRLIYSDTDPLPQAVFTHRLGVQVLSPSSGVGPTSSWGMPYLHRSPSSIVAHKFIRYESANSGHAHFALMLWPATTADPAQQQKFPVVHGVYAGPSIQLVKNTWQTISQYLKFVSFGYAVVLVDGRGSANRGVKFEATIKERLGSVEVQDQVEGLREAAKESGGRLDLDRVVVIGWSYGGYMSLQLLAEYPNIYKAGCVGGAVTDWQLYDTAYTERYMGLPQMNSEEYKQSAVLSKISKLPNQEGRLLIVHGMIDENVHFQHTVRLINGLISAQKPHQLLLFPGERHAIRNGESIEHFHATILSFFGKAVGNSNNKSFASTAPMSGSSAVGQ